jgi:WhiB family transcriptional regulator, redox-sensing transcriptional regulator
MNRYYRSASTAQSGLTMSVPKYSGRPACEGAEDPDLFFPVGHGFAAQRQAQEAKDICSVCPIKAKCLDDAMETWDDFGIRGGTTADERRKLARQAVTNVRSENAGHRDRTDLVRQLASQG